MKKSTSIISLLIALISVNVAFAQKPTTKKKAVKSQPAKMLSALKEEVKIINTNRRSVVVMANFLNEGITASILKQMSAKQFKDFKMHCNEDDHSLCIKEKLAYNPANADEDASEVTIKSLKLYRIAKFKNIQNGKDFGEDSILIAPAKENKNIGGDCNYDQDFYFIIPSTDIKISK